MKIILFLIGMSLLPTTSFAKCSQPVTLLTQGEPSPCEGFLFSREKEAEVRSRVEAAKHLQEELDLNLKLIELHEARVDLLEDQIAKEQKMTSIWKNRALELNEDYIQQNNRNFYQQIGLVSGGIAVTLLSAWALGQIAK